MGQSGTAKLILPVNIAYLPAVQQFIGELARTAGLPQKDIDLLLLAVEEATTNVIQHAFLPDEDATFEVTCELTPLEFVVKIRDKGLPFDPERVEEFKFSPDLEDIYRPGLGLQLMKRGVDKFSFNNLGYEGKEVVLSKFIEQRHIEDYFSPALLKEFEEITPPAKDLREKIPFRVELLKPEQAIEVAQCAYRTYGYTYGMENVYYPQRLIQMTRTGDLVSVVASSTVNQEVMAHCALEFHGRKHGIPEIGMAFTKPQYRGMGCLGKINEYILNYAHKTHIKGIYAKAVTTHPYSQKAADKSGFIPCGLLVGLSPPIQFSRMNKRLNQRETLVLYYLKMCETPPMKIFAPPSHREMIERIFREINVGVEFAAQGTWENTGFTDEHSHLECEINNRRQMANVSVLKSGKDLEQKLHIRLKELCLKKIEAINIYLHLTDPLIDQAVGMLEKRNCYFAGVFPAYPTPSLILQYLNNVYVDYDQIKTHHPFARELLEYIKERDPNLI